MAVHLECDAAYKHGDRNRVYDLFSSEPGKARHHPSRRHAHEADHPVAAYVGGNKGERKRLPSHPEEVQRGDPECKGVQRLHQEHQYRNFRRVKD